MLLSARHLRGYGVRTTTNIGTVKDFYFDDHAWRVRYVIVDTGSWLVDRKVLISPQSIGDPDRSKKILPTNLTSEQVEKSPPVAAHQPISRQQEMRLVEYYTGWEPYWLDPVLAAEGMPVMGEVRGDDGGVPAPPEDINLRSMKEVEGYHIKASDGAIGHLEDFVVDTARHEWWIRHLVVDLRDWLPGRKVLVSPNWVVAINWDHKQVSISRPKEEIRSSPNYDPHQPINREYEVALYDYYGEKHCRE